MPDNPPTYDPTPPGPYDHLFRRMPTGQAD